MQAELRSIATALPEHSAPQRATAAFMRRVAAAAGR